MASNTGSQEIMKLEESLNTANKEESQRHEQVFGFTRDLRTTITSY